MVSGRNLFLMSSSDGSYSVSLAPGVYSVTVSFKGFARQTRKDLKVAAAASLPADFTLAAQLEEQITVTALKREETLQNVPFSVAAPTEEDLRSRGVEDIEGVAANVGGFTVQNLGPGQSPSGGWSTLHVAAAYARTEGAAARSSEEDAATCGSSRDFHRR
jgi:hypothetical protein